MKRHTCKTYFAVWLKFDEEKNRRLLRQGPAECAPEEIGIFNKEEVGERLLALTDRVIWRRHHFLVGLNETYAPDVNEMIAVTLKDLIGKEEELRAIQRDYGVSMTLEIVPHIVHDSEESTQILSLGRETIDFLSKAGADMDLDYYIV